MNRIFITISIILLHTSPLVAQFPPQALVAGSTAVNATDGRFAGWATSCDVKRGYMDIADPSLGFASAGYNTSGTGKPDQMIVSLGDSGVATLGFESVLYNGAGFDFAVFENGFPNPNNPEESFIELAFVEVSSDGVNFFRFPASSLTPDTSQIPMAGVYMNARKINNLAGKYIGGWGTPFDLQELAGTPGLDINHITHIRLADVIGSVDSRASKDKDGNIINDPYPTPIPGGGFDLDAVGAFYLEGKFPAGLEANAKPAVMVYPNPASDKLFVQTGTEARISIMDITGKTLYSAQLNGGMEISFSAYNSGIYYLVINNVNGQKWVEKITKL